MKRHVILASFLALLVLLLLWFWRSRSATSHAGGISDAQSPSARSEQQNSQRSTATDVRTDPPLNQLSRLEQLREIARESNKPIQFYGMVIDQHDNPIPGVKVTLSIRTAKEVKSGVIEDLFEHPVVTTGTDGRFALMNVKGALLSVKSLEKPSYEASEKSLNRAHYWYWRDPSQVFHPNADRPEVFRMWKKSGAEKLIIHDRMTRIPYDGRAVTFDLVTGRETAEGGDFRVSLVRNPQQVRWGQRNYEWTLTITAVDGGLVASSDEQMYQAPANGYQPALVIHMSADDPRWTDDKSIEYYLKSQGGRHYSSVRLGVMVGSEKPTTGLTFRSFLNPSGSRNLEYDPLQDVVPSARSQPSANPPQR